MAADKKRNSPKDEVANEEKKRSPLKTTLKILTGILILAAIPSVLYNPDISLGPLDILRQEFFKTELVLTGEKFSADGFVQTIRSTDARRVKLYIRSGANVNSIGKAGISPLCAAAQTGNKEIVNILLSSDANVLLKNTANGLTPPFCAIEGNNVDVLDKILNQGVSVRTRTATGLSLVQYAALLGHEQILSYLLSKGADPNMQNIFGQTALHYAVTQDNSYILNILLNAGAIVDIEDTQGNTPISLAEDLGKTSYVRLLNRYSSTKGPFNP